MDRTHGCHNYETAHSMGIELRNVGCHNKKKNYETLLKGTAENYTIKKHCTKVC